MAREWTVAQIRELVQHKFQKRACWFQIQVALALHRGKDVVACAPSGAGKTLSFWIHLLMALEEGQDKMTVVITPLNILGQQNVEMLEKAGMRAVSITRKTARPVTFQNIKEGMYRVILISPELLMGNDKMKALLGDRKFVARILNFIFDEGHCIVHWGVFRKDYLGVGTLRYLVPESIPILAILATVPPEVLAGLQEILRLRPANTEYILRSNDQPNIHLRVRPLVFPANGFKDLAFLLPDIYMSGELTSRPPKFVVFFDDTKETEAACEYLRSRLPDALKDKIKYFHATMSPTYHEEETTKFECSDIWGMCCTDAFGMGVDIPDVEIIVQFKATCNLCTLWQRFGRAARGSGKEGTAILLVEKKDTADGRLAKAVAQEKWASTAAAKRKAAANLQSAMSKRLALEDQNTNMPLAAGTGTMIEGDEEVGEDEDEELESWMVEKRLQYATVRKEKEPGKKGKGKDVDIGSAMDDYINPHPSVGCRRTVPMLYFGNDKLPISDHVHCDTESPTGCERCKPQISRLCCDYCNPDAFDNFDVPYQAPPKMAAKSNLKPYERQPREHNLKAAILKWRRENALAKFNAELTQIFGPMMLLADEQVDRIVDCIHYQKISNVDQLVKETGLRKDWAEELGESLVQLLHDHYLPPAAPAPRTNLPRKRIGPVRCSACGNLGHNRASASCPKKEDERVLRLTQDDARRQSQRPVNNENDPPPSSTSTSQASQALIISRRPPASPSTSPARTSRRPVNNNPPPPLSSTVQVSTSSALLSVLPAATCTSSTSTSTFSMAPPAATPASSPSTSTLPAFYRHLQSSASSVPLAPASTSTLPSMAPPAATPASSPSTSTLPALYRHLQSSASSVPLAPASTSTLPPYYYYYLPYNAQPPPGS